LLTCPNILSLYLLGWNSLNTNYFTLTASTIICNNSEIFQAYDFLRIKVDSTVELFPIKNLNTGGPLHTEASRCVAIEEYQSESVKCSFE